MTEFCTKPPFPTLFPFLLRSFRKPRGVNLRDVFSLPWKTFLSSFFLSHSKADRPADQTLGCTLYRASKVEGKKDSNKSRLSDDDSAFAFCSLVAKNNHHSSFPRSTAKASIAPRFLPSLLLAAFWSVGRSGCRRRSINFHLGPSSAADSDKWPLFARSEQRRSLERHPHRAPSTKKRPTTT